MNEHPVPSSYHQAITSHLRTAEPGLWKWFSSGSRRGAEADAVRLDLLKTAYRLVADSSGGMCELAAELIGLMGLTATVTLYQSQIAQGLNAALVYLPGEAHIVLSGPWIQALTASERRAVLAHELGHYHLLEHDGGEYRVAEDLLAALAADAGAGPAAGESARLFRLWTEIHADRWACLAAGPDSAIAALLKTTTGLADVDVTSYLRQAEEILSKAATSTEGVTHPEPYIRARAVKLWSELGSKCDAEIEKYIHGPRSLERLDLLSQTAAAEFTRALLQALLAPRWFRTDSVTSHARQFFPDFEYPADPPDPAAIRTQVDSADRPFRDYCCYLLLDFVTVDRELGDPALAAAIRTARGLGLDARFAELVQKELGVGKKAFGRIEKDVENILARTEAAYPA